MATPKRNSNDRNAKAIAERKAAAKPDTFILTSRYDPALTIEVKLRPISYIEINEIVESVDIPEKPTYETRTSSGRVERFPLDDKVVEQSPEYEEEWKQWKLDYSNALREQSKRSTRAMFLDGTIVPDDWYDAKWERRMRLISYKLPTDPEELWLLYLETGITKEVAGELVIAIMSLTTLPEEVIEAATQTFRDSLRADIGSGDLDVVGTDPQGVAIG